MKVVATVEFDILVDMDETMFDVKEWTSSINGKKYIDYEIAEGREEDVDNYIKDLQEKVSFNDKELDDVESFEVVIGSGHLVAISDLNDNLFYME
jgi:hypothetical protein